MILFPQEKEKENIGEPCQKKYGMIQQNTHLTGHAGNDTARIMEDSSMSPEDRCNDSHEHA